MHSYAAFLGHQPHLSVAELSAAVPGFDLETILDNKIALFSSSAELDNAFLQDLGGIVFLARQVTDQDVSLEDIPRMLVNEITGSRGKIVFSYRCHGIAPKTMRALHKRTKELFKKAGRTARYVGSERKGAFPVQLYEHDMLSAKKGVEIVVIKSGRGLWVGRTVGAQDVDAYSKRDMDKPVRDTKVGLLPPKLAQVLLNFGSWLLQESGPFDKAQDKKRKEESGKRKKGESVTVFDPFCGTGVIPLECLLRGWHVVASDVSQKAVNGCTKNCDWLRKEEKILKKDVATTIAKHDATKPFDKLKVTGGAIKEGISVIVTETSLGPNCEKRMTATEAKKALKDNEALQADFLNNASETLPGVPIVCIWPVWYLSKGGQICLEKVWKAAADAGYEPVLPPETKGWKSGRISLLYRRPGQFVGREIVLLKPTVQ